MGKDFTWNSDVRFALYTKQGWETMACIKPMDQFDLEAELHGELGPTPVVQKPTPVEPPAIQKYSGFTEHAYRFMYNYEDKFTESPKLLTILPNGTIEKEKGLIAYTYPQDIETSAAQKHLATPEAAPFVW